MNWSVMIIAALAAAVVMGAASSPRPTPPAMPIHVSWSLPLSSTTSSAARTCG